MPPEKEQHGDAGCAGQPSRDVGGGTRPKSEDVVSGGDPSLRSSLDRRTGYIAGITAFGLKRVQYSAVRGMAIFEADIALGPVEKVEKSKAAADTAGVLRDMPAGGGARLAPNIQHGVAIVGQRYRWPGGVVPYEVQPELRQTVDEAIQHWETNTTIRFVERTVGNVGTYPNYVSIEVQDGCWSAVGMQGGKQVISLGLGCGFGQAVHEIGHALGLWHEQSREDRDQYIRIAWEIIMPGMEHNFNQHVTDGDDIGGYDYDSIMHYPATAFSATGQPTIVPLGGQPIGQRQGMSAGDIAAIAALYPSTIGGDHFYTASPVELQYAVTNAGYQKEGVACYVLGAPALGATPLFRLSNPKAGFLYSTSTLEVYDAVLKKGYTFDAVACYVLPFPLPGVAPLYHLGKKDESDHLYTTSLTEVYQAVGEFSYEGQGIAGYVCSVPCPGTVPFYRLRKPG